MDDTLDKVGIKTVKTEPKTSKGATDEKVPVKQASTKVERDARGRLLPGSTANPNGRPPANQTIVDRFRSNEKAQSVINKLINVASTIDDPKPHKDAISACKMIVERLLPSLKASELRVDTDNDQGFVLLPTPEEPDKE